MNRRLPLFAAVAGLLFATGAVAGDWPSWRGPEGNSISREKGLPDTISPKGGEGSNLLWSRLDVGARGTPIVMQGKIYYLARHNPATPNECEKVVCLDAATGQTVWESIHNVWSSDVPDTRVGWAAMAGDPETGYVYSMGACGIFQCHAGETGKIVWQIPLHEQFGVLTTYGGRTNTPLIVDDLVILGSVVIGWGEMAVPAHRILAFDKKTGQVAWFVSTRLRPEDTIYNCPTVAVIKGQKLIITGSGDGWVYAYQPRTGKKVWEYQLSRRGLNLSPTVDGDIIYMGHSEENRADPKFPKLAGIVGAVAAIKADLTGDITETGGEIWKQLELTVGKASILKVGDRLYCGDDAGKLYVLDAKTGDMIGPRHGVGTINYASPLYADGKIYHLEKNGRWYILTPDEAAGLKKPVRNKTMGNFPTGDECWASPVVANGRLYILTTGGMYCFEDQAKEKSSDPIPPMPTETPAANTDQPAQLQVFPTELLLRPGEKVTFQARLFNDRGQRLPDQAATFAVEGPGAVSEKGEFTAAADAAHAAAYITATVGELKGRARIRIVPPLPWKFDFDQLTDAPITWVGARYRHVIRKVDGNNVMVKVTTIPKGTRSRASLGHSDLHDYTVQAEMKPLTANSKLPDIGLIAQGYTFEMSGLNKRLMINSWISHDKRHFVTLPFEMKPDTWYVLKLKASNQGDQALVQGKVWVKGEPEPEAWTLELTDPLPNKTGAPGLFGNATNAEIFIDNVTVTPNS